MEETVSGSLAVKYRRAGRSSYEPNLTTQSYKNVPGEGGADRGLGCFMVVSFIVSVLKMDALIFYFDSIGSFFYLGQEKRKRRMSASLYLQNALEQILKCELDFIDEKNNDEDLNILHCLTKSIQCVCDHHDISLSKKQLDNFIVESSLCDNENESFPFPCFPWNECEGFKEFEHSFNRNVRKSIQFSCVRNTKLPTKSSCKRVEIGNCANIDDLLANQKENTNDKNKLVDVLGVFTTRNVDKSVSTYGIFVSLDKTLNTYLYDTKDELSYVATVPDSKIGIVFSATPSGVCSILHLSISNGKAYIEKRPVEFMLDLPDGSKLNFLECRRSSTEGDLILFWECGDDSKADEKSSFYTGINESALRLLGEHTEKKLDRLFRAVHEENLDFMTFTKPRIHTQFDSVKDEEDQVLFEHNFGRIHADCSSLKKSSKSKCHELVILVPAISCAAKCPKPSKCNTCGNIMWIYENKFGKLLCRNESESAIKGGKVEEIISMSIF